MSWGVIQQILLPLDETRLTVSPFFFSLYAKDYKKESALTDVTFNRLSFCKSWSYQLWLQNDSLHSDPDTTSDIFPDYEALGVAPRELWYVLINPAFVSGPYMLPHTGFVPAWSVFLLQQHCCRICWIGMQLDTPLCFSGVYSRPGHRQPGRKPGRAAVQQFKLLHSQHLSSLLSSLGKGKLFFLSTMHAFAKCYKLVTRMLCSSSDSIY